MHREGTENNQFLLESRSAQELSSQFVSCETLPDGRAPSMTLPTLLRSLLPLCPGVRSYSTSLTSRKSKKRSVLLLGFCWLAQSLAQATLALNFLPTKHLIATSCVPCTLTAVSSHLHLGGIFRKSFRLMFCAATL